MSWRKKIENEVRDRKADGEEESSGTVLKLNSLKRSRNRNMKANRSTREGSQL
jgi:hypothetical protein